jgi:hypothetical protein
MVVFNYVRECTVGVDVRDGTTLDLKSVLSNIVMGCIVLGRQMDVYFATTECNNTISFVGMDVRFCTMQIHDSTTLCNQPTISIVVHLAVIQSNVCICITTVYPTTSNIFQKLTSCCCSSGTIFHNHPTIPTLFETTLRYINIGPTPFTHQT